MAVAQSVQFACRLKATEFVLFCCLHRFLYVEIQHKYNLKGHTILQIFENVFKFFKGFVGHGLCRRSRDY
jgi:hypothetical protein